MTSSELRTKYVYAKRQRTWVCCKCRQRHRNIVVTLERNVMLNRVDGLQFLPVV